MKRLVFKAGRYTVTLLHSQVFSERRVERSGLMNESVDVVS